MNTFRKNKIRNKPPRKLLSEKAKQQLMTVCGVVLLIMFVYYGLTQALSYIGGSRILSVFTGVLGKSLLVDDQNHTNILALGVGGEGHDGGDLTDTIIIVSIDHTNGWISMNSIPRDMYFETLAGNGRVNGLYELGKSKWGEEQGLDFVRTTLSEQLDIPLHYVVKINFQAFQELVDSVGGVDVYVDKAINDQLYPKGETHEYQPFYLAEGLQHLDGETALKYVRSRKSTSDFDRSKRQQKVLVALKNKAQGKNLLQKTSFLEDTYQSLKKNIQTDLSLREMISLAEFASSWKSENLSSATLNNEPTYRGGLLYVPSREFFGGAYVLLPAGGDFNSIQKFIKLALYGPRNLLTTEIAILNGTKIGGFAGRGANILNRFGVNIETVKNARETQLSTTTWYVRDESNVPLVEALTTLIPGAISTTIPEQYNTDPDLGSAKILLELGANAEESIKKLDIFRNITFTQEAATVNPPADPAPAQ